MSGQGLFDLTGKTVLITGSSQGLGHTLARGFAEHGARVILNGRNADRLEAARQALEESHPGQIAAAKFDVTDPESVDSGITTAERHVGSVDILVNNAGLQLRGLLSELSADTWNSVISTNLSGAFFVSQRVARKMISARRGKIINICSLMSEVARRTIIPYTAAKGGLKMLTRALATELAEHNIQVNGIGPGYFLTEMTQPLKDDEKFDNWLVSRTPSARWGDPRELVGTAVYLASDATSFVTGQIIYVDGGILATI